MTLQKASSPSRDALEILLGDQYLIERGLWTERAADILLGYAYMQSGVEKVVLEIDLDEKNSGKSPKVTYKVKLQKSFSKKYTKISKANTSTAWGKLQMLWLMKRGIPSPGSLESGIMLLASQYLPRFYKIEVILEN